MKSPFVIAVTGMMGSGKSTLADRLSQSLNDAIVLCEDHFHHTMDHSPDFAQTWLDTGADPESIDLTAFRTELCRLCQSGQDRVRYVIIESQFGRHHPVLRDMINWQCCIHVPADVAISRKLRQCARDVLSSNQTEDLRGGLEWISGFCESWVTTVRHIIAEQQEWSGKHADLILDGLQSPDELCRQVTSCLPI